MTKVAPKADEVGEEESSSSSDEMSDSSSAACSDNEDETALNKPVTVDIVEDGKAVIAAIKALELQHGTVVTNKNVVKSRSTRRVGVGSNLEDLNAMSPSVPQVHSAAENASSQAAPMTQDEAVQAICCGWRWAVGEQTSRLD